MPFNNDIAGGNGSLVRNWIQSANYVAGTTGWRIAKDGSAEFNNGTFRGSIEVGPIAGQHFIVNNPATGDVVDVYNTSNLLVTKIDSVGGVWTISQPSQDSVVQFGSGLSWQNLTSVPSSGASILGTSNSTGSQLDLSSGGGPANAGQAFLTLMDSAANGGLSNIQVSQRAGVGGVGAIGGTIVQTDTNNINSQVHMDIYNVAVAGALGMALFSHNCSFTPKGGIIGPLTHFTQWNWNNSFGVNGFTSSQAQVTLYQPNGTALTNTSPASFFGLFWA